MNTTFPGLTHLYDNRMHYCVSIVLVVVQERKKNDLAIVLSSDELGHWRPSITPLGVYPSGLAGESALPAQRRQLPGDDPWHAIWSGYCGHVS